MDACRSPVTLLIFNRPDVTARVFARVAAQRPPRLLVVADGPRPRRPEDVAACAAARAVTEQVDWPCEVSRDYAASNLGCRRRIASGLDWAFGLVDRSIILEDDCLPDASFFRYCDELLERYLDAPMVMHVAGTSVSLRWRERLTRGGGASYLFSRYAPVWGWATWRRAWAHYDGEMRDWPALRGEWLERALGDPRGAAYWRTLFDLVYDGRIDTWDWQWNLACWRARGLSALPNVNLVENVGFGAGATNTTASAWSAAAGAEAMQFPLVHPPLLRRNLEADLRIQGLMYEVMPAERALEILRGVPGGSPAPSGA